MVSTASFEFSHGRKPRGTGTWAFFINGSQTPVFINGSYGEAKVQAVKAAGRYGKVVVGS